MHVVFHWLGCSGKCVCCSVFLFQLVSCFVFVGCVDVGVCFSFGGGALSVGTVSMIWV